MNSIFRSDLNLHHVAIIRPNNDIRYCFLIKDEYINIMTGLTEDCYEDVIGIVPVDITSEIIRVTETWEVTELEKYNVRLNNGQYFRFSGKSNNYTSYPIFVYDYCNYYLLEERYWDLDVLLKKFEGYTKVELVDISYTIKNHYAEASSISVS